MIRLYSRKKQTRILHRCGEWIAQCETRYGVPSPCLRAVLRMELSRIDILDLLADILVAFYWRRYDLRRRLGMHALPRGKKDSSTGYAQVFAATAVRSITAAAGHGITLPDDMALPPLDAGPETLEAVWRKLNRDPRFNLHMAALTLLDACRHITGHACFECCDDTAMKRIFSRYNADTRQITAYGEEAFGIYCEENTKQHPQQDIGRTAEQE